MKIEIARQFLIKSSLLITGLQMIFLLIAPVFGYPLIYPKNLDILEIISPVFLGYLGAATHFIFRPPQSDNSIQNIYLPSILYGPVVIYVTVVVGMFAAYGYSNRANAAIGEGISKENLATALSFALSFLAVTTGVISSYLFSSQPTE